MRLNSSDLLFGIKAKNLRDFFRYYDDNFSDKSFYEKLNIEPSIANKILEDMIKDEIIESWKMPEQGEHRKFYKVLTKGHAIKNARFIKPILKEKADKILKELIERIKILNSDEYYLSKVEELYAFGSYITDAKDFGDIDLAFDVIPKRNYSTKEMQKFCRERQKNGMNMLESYAYPIHEEPLKFLKKRSPYLSFHTISAAKQVEENLKLIWKNDV